MNLCISPSPSKGADGPRLSLLREPAAARRPSVTRALVVALGLALLELAACTCDPSSGTDGGTGGGTGGSQADWRCNADLTPFLTGASGTVRARQVASTADLIGGPNAQGKVGDYLLENEKVRVVVQAGERVFGPQPYGGTLLDADLVRSGPGADQFGEIGLLYNFGRTVKPDRYEVLADGSDGKAAIVAASGDDAANDYLAIRTTLAEKLGEVPAADPYVGLPLRITNYFILNAGEQRVRYVTAFCSTSATDTTSLAVGDLTDPGYVLEFMNPLACTGGYGFGGVCAGLDRMSWYGYQGADVAYAYAPYKPGSPTLPQTQNATLSVAGITGSILGANGISGLMAWKKDGGQPRDGELRLGPRGKSLIARDFWVGHDLGELSRLIEKSRAAITNDELIEVTGTVTASGQPLEGARVVFDGDQGRSAYTTAADGSFTATLHPGTFTASAWAPGCNPTAKQTLSVIGSSPPHPTFELVAPRKLTVSATEAGGGPMPAKVTVFCKNGLSCATPHHVLVTYTDVAKDPVPDNVALVGYVPASGSVTLALPPDLYDVVVSRGPEYSVFPNAFPAVPGVAVDVRSQDATVDAELAKVLDTTGWMSGDFHVHAVNSPDSIVDNETRALTFAADGVEILVSTDHDVVTDYGPVIRKIGLTPFLATVIGEEISPMEFGHYNIFPLTYDPADGITGGNVDWAGGEGPTLSVREIFQAARTRGATTVHFNHPRGTLGGFSYLKVDTDTLATHLDPAAERMAAQPDATAGDTKLVSTDFNALEVLNPGEDGYDGTSSDAHARFNDWFTLLSRGLLVAGTGVSDTHYRSLATGWRTWVKLGVDAPAQLTAAALSSNVNAMRAVVSNGPFVAIKAYRVDSGGAQTTSAVRIGETLGAPFAQRVGVEVEVQVPEYLDVTKVELYLHRPEDDLPCPIDPTNPRAATTRVACHGQLNRNWPASSVAASQAVALSPADLEQVSTSGSTVFKRYRKTVSFTLPAPTTDNWLVAFVYGSKSLAPLLFPYPGLSGSVSPTTPFAFTNPILIDADGGGYDKPPFSTTRMKKGLAPVEPPARDFPTDEASFAKRWGEIFHAH